jgi:hypothetical protein
LRNSINLICNTSRVDNVCVCDPMGRDRNC